MAVPFKPCYSHGGPTVGPNWPAVLGTTVSKGRPMGVAGAHPHFWPTVMIFCVGGTATVKIENNGAELDSTGHPTEADYVDITGGGYSMNDGDVKEVKVPPTVPWYRTNITAISGATVHSYVPFLVTVAGQLIAASFPSFLNQLPYNPPGL